MSSAEIEQWRSLIEQRCGLHFTDGRLYFMQQRIWERLTQIGFSAYTEYYNHIVFHPEGNREWAELLERLVNNESLFFRHIPSYTALSEHVLPELLDRKRTNNNQTISFWSAGCSGGQEPYSLAMALIDKIDRTVFDLRIWGSDISQKQIERARRGQYRSHEIRTLPSPYRKLYMRQIENGRLPTFQVDQRIQQMVQFGIANLLDPKIGWLNGQDVIFCQNVLIYFTKDDRMQIARRLVQHLNPGGYLFLGPAEVVGLRGDNIRLVRLPDSLIYQRTK